MPTQFIIYIFIPLTSFLLVFRRTPICTNTANVFLIFYFFSFFSFFFIIIYFSYLTKIWRITLHDSKIWQITHQDSKIWQISRHDATRIFLLHLHPSFFECFFTLWSTMIRYGYILEKQHYFCWISLR